MLSTRNEFGNALQQMQKLEREMNRLFYDQPVNGLSRGRTMPKSEYPAINAWEDENTLTLEAELPGVLPEDLDVQVHGGNQLTIKGSRAATEGDGAWHRQERGHGSFARTLKLPVDVDADNVEAELKNGLLVVKLQKRPEFQPRKIEVKTA